MNARSQSLCFLALLTACGADSLESSERPRRIAPIDDERADGEDSEELAFSASSYAVDAGGTVDIVVVRHGAIDVARRATVVIAGGAAGEVYTQPTSDTVTLELAAGSDRAAFALEIGAAGAGRTLHLTLTTSEPVDLGLASSEVPIRDPAPAPLFRFRTPSSSLTAGTASTPVTVERTGSSVGAYDVPVTSIATELTAFSVTPPVLRFAEGAATAEITVDPGTSAGTLVIELGSPTLLTHGQAATAEGTHTVTVTAASRVCPNNAGAYLPHTALEGWGMPHWFWAQLGNVNTFPLPKELVPGRPITSGMISSTSTPSTNGDLTVEWSLSRCPGDMDWYKTDEASTVYNGITFRPCGGVFGIESGGVTWSPDWGMWGAHCKVDPSETWYINLRYVAACPVGDLCPIFYAWSGN
jgi:hypothetical protein